MNCSLNAPQVAAHVDSGEALAKMLLSILLCISAIPLRHPRKTGFPFSEFQIPRFPIPDVVNWAEPADKYFPKNAH
jgi:hypothetical protein